MIRLPPTTISLGRSDLADFDKRRKSHRAAAAIVEDDFARFSIARQSSSLFSDVSPAQIFLPHKVVPDYDSQASLSNLSIDFRSSTQQGSYHSELDDEHSVAQNSSTINEDSCTLVGVEEGGYDQRYKEPQTRLENSSQIHSSSPAKDDFHYGGFIESPGGDLLSNQSSPLVPCDVSTPKGNSLPSLRTFRTRMPLPRSPLFLSQNTSISPEQRPTSGLTPRVASQVATHNTPGIMFAQPARRPPRQTPRALRHQTNSFSFDSSERASAAYEQDRRSSTSTDNSTFRLTEETSLHEELRGSSLQSSRVTSSVSVPLQISLDTGKYGTYPRSGRNILEETTTDLFLSSPRLPLPPPFSTVPRTVSRVGSLPSSPAGDHMPCNPQTSPIPIPDTSSIETDINSSPPTGDVLGQISEASAIKGLIAHEDDTACIQPTNGGSSSRSFNSLTPESSHAIDPHTPSRSYQVYNDALSPTIQPQTPAQLPESRHRSRHHPSYTAPAARAARRRAIWHVDGNGGFGNETLGRLRPTPTTTPVRIGRSTSPLGLSHDGFHGLYGGRENGDEERNWVEGVRFNNAETRLWGSRDGRNDGRNLRETPEPEDWRVGRRS